MAHTREDPRVKYALNDLVSALREADRVSGSAYDRAEGILIGQRWTQDEAERLITLIKQGEATIERKPLEVRMLPAAVGGGFCHMLCDATGEALPNQEMCTVVADEGTVTVTVRLFVDGKRVRLGTEEDALRRVLG